MSIGGEIKIITEAPQDRIADRAADEGEAIALLFKGFGE
jgi:hypothetical protein